MTLIEEEGHGSDEAGHTKIKKVQNGTTKYFKDVELKIINVRNSTMMINAPLK